MARFRFPLVRLLRVREIHEELARNDLLGAEAALRESERRVELARAEQREAEEQLALLQARSAIMPGEVLAAQGTVPALAVRVAAKRAEARRAAEAAEAAREAWMAARVDVRVLERLEERSHVAFRDGERAREDKVTQELVDRRAALAGAPQSNEGER